MATIAYLIVATAVAWLGIVLVGLGGFFFVTVAALMGTLKLAGIIAWPWSWTLLPLWGVLGIVAMRPFNMPPCDELLPGVSINVSKKEWTM